MSLEPQVSFYNRTTNVDLSVSGWTVGTVKASEESSVLALRVWNNRGGSELASSMQDCSLFILDSLDGKSEPIVTGGWLKGKCLSLGDSSFIALDAVDVLEIGSQSHPTDTIIDGDINDGTDTNVSNFSDIDLKFVPAFGATHGLKNFSVAIKYFFV